MSKIEILVGENGSGKSKYLSTIPGCLYCNPLYPDRSDKKFLDLVARYLMVDVPPRCTYPNGNDVGISILWSVYQMLDCEGLDIALIHPENDLHPRLQRKVVAGVVELTRAYNARLWIETHSATIMNWFGACIEQGKIDFSDVVVRKFEDGHETVCGFDEDGYLLNWTVGFLT